MQERAKSKKSISSLRILLLGFAVVTVAGITYRFVPAVKSFVQTAKTAVVSLSEDVSLTGIFYTDDNPLAVVDGKAVHQGDVINGVKVLRIYKHKVEFEKSGRSWSQSLPAVEEKVDSDLPTLLVLGAQKRCPPCRQMMPILNEFRTGYASKFRTRYIDVDADRTAGAKYKVSAIPTLIFHNSKDKELFRHVGFFSKRDILATWKRLGF